MSNYEKERAGFILCLNVEKKAHLVKTFVYKYKIQFLNECKKRILHHVFRVHFASTDVES